MNADERPRADHWRRASVAGLTWWLITVIAVGIAGSPGNAEGLGYLAGRLMVPFLLAALITGALARRADRRWGWARHLLITLLIGSVFALVVAIGQLGSP